MKLIISGTVPSLKNSKQIYRTRSGKPFITSSDKAKEWTETAVTELQEQFKGYRVTDYPITVAMMFYNKDNIRRDLDNQCSTVLDALRHSGVIAEDDNKHINCLVIKYGGLDKTNPRVEIELKD